MGDVVGFTGGEKLQAYLAKAAEQVQRPGTLRVGFLEGTTEKDGTSLPTVAAAQEFGAPSKGIPPRPFFRNMIAKESGHWGDDTAQALKATGMDGAAALDLMGKRIAAELAQSIVDTNSPPLSPKTIAAKSASRSKRKRKSTAKALGVLGPEKPLVDSGTMLQTAGKGYEVVK